MKKFIIIIIILLIAGVSYGQPVIDSMLIDEMKSELHIYGKFGAVEGKVSIDSVDMQVKSWSDSLITTSIPDTGRGSAGPVVVSTSSLHSNERVITQWEVKTRYSSVIYHSCASYESDTAVYELFFRYDIQSILGSNQKSQPIQFFGIMNSLRIDFKASLCRYPCCPTDQYSISDSISTPEYKYKIIIDLLKHTITPILDLEGGPIDRTLPFPHPKYLMDSTYRIISGKFDSTNGTGSFEHISWGESKIKFSPKPDMLFVTNLNQEYNLKLRAFPNPVSKALNISFKLPDNENARVILYDLTGRVIRENRIFNSGSSQLQKWDVSQIESGTYILGLITEKEKKSQILEIIH